MLNVFVKVFMALYDPDSSRCPLCGERLYETEDMIATTHFIGNHDDPLYRFSDACIHRSCFLEWEYRNAFVTAYNNSKMKQWSKMRDDGYIVEKSFFEQAIEALLTYCRLMNR
jgi:hypothetical protein